MKRTRMGAIDVGTSKVCTVMGDTEGKDLRVVGVGIAPSRGIQKGVVIDIDEAKGSIRQSVRAAEKVAGYWLDSACVCVTGRHVNSANSRGAVAITRSDYLVRPADFKRALGIACGMGLREDSELLHVIPRNYLVDGQEGVKNPVGMHGSRLDVETHVVAAAATSIQNLTKCVRGIGVEIDDLVLAPLASAEALLTNEEKQQGVVLADIGGGTSGIAVFRDNSIYHTSILPIAGNQITNDLAAGLGLPFDLAEEMKKKYGNVMPGEEKDSKERTLTEDDVIVSYRDFSDIVRIRVEELLHLIMMELPRTDYAKFVRSGLVLTGGTAKLRGIAELAEKVTRLPVRVGIPAKLYGVADALCDPAYSASVGLLLWRTGNSDIQGWQSEAKGLRGFASRVFGWHRPQ